MRTRSMLAGLCLAMGGFLASSASAQVAVETWYPDTDSNRVTFVGSAGHALNDYWNLTFAQTGSEAGAVWLNGVQDFRFGFVVIVDYYIAPNAGGLPGYNADGIVLTFQKEGQNAIGSPGQGIGAYINNEFGGNAIDNGFGVEIDTWNNHDDCGTDHISVQGMNSLGQMSGEAFDMILGCYPLGEGAALGEHRLLYRWTDNQASIVFDTTVLANFVPQDWPLTGTNPRNCYVGITGGTGDFYNASYQVVENITITRRISPHENPGDCRAADWDMDGGISMNDVTSFFNSFFASGSLLVNEDIFAFLETWFMCPG